MEAGFRSRKIYTILLNDGNWGSGVVAPVGSYTAEFSSSPSPNAAGNGWRNATCRGRTVDGGDACHVSEGESPVGVAVGSSERRRERFLAQVLEPRDGRVHHEALGIIEVHQKRDRRDADAARHSPGPRHAPHERKVQIAAAQQLEGPRAGRLPIVCKTRAATVEPARRGREDVGRPIIECAHANDTRAVRARRRRRRAARERRRRGEQCRPDVSHHKPKARSQTPVFCEVGVTSGGSGLQRFRLF